MGLLEILLILLILGAFGGGVYAGNNLLHVVWVVVLVFLLVRLLGHGGGL